MKTFFCILVVLVGPIITSDTHQTEEYEILLFDKNGDKIWNENPSPNDVTTVWIQVVKGSGEDISEFDENSAFKIRKGRLFVSKQDPREFNGQKLELEVLDAETTVGIALDEVVEVLPDGTERKIEIKTKFRSFIIK